MRRGKLIVNLPGSVRGATESLASIADLLPHAIELLRGRTAHPE
jgi:molybdopterin biosynthesis enzyme MoaB